MLRLPSRIRAGREIPTSSLADIAFLLLIFFLVTTVFDEERGLSMVFPPPDSPIDVPAENVLHVIVRTDGLVDLRPGTSSFARVVRARDIPDLWREAHAQNPLLIAAVQTHPEAPYARMIDVLDALQGAGAERVSLRQLEP
ncbi:MAG: biopolymer transporter ExbD [Gemmatimonadota bacterium]